MKRLITISIAAIFLGTGCSQGPSADIDRLVAQSVTTRPISADESLETLARTDRSIEIALQTIVENIANAKTTGYKSRRVLFQSGVTPLIHLDAEQGSMESTGSPLDLAIQGSGFFSVKLPTGKAGVGYVRNGSLFRNKNGELISCIRDGCSLIPQISVPPSVPDDNISIGQDGMVEYIAPGSSIKTRAGRIQLTQFPNVQGLQRFGADIYLETDDSGAPIVGNAGELGRGVILSGFLEASNVNLNAEELRRIAAERWRAVIDRAIARASDRR